MKVSFSSFLAAAILAGQANAQLSTGPRRHLRALSEGAANVEFELDADLTLSMPTSIGFAHGDDESGWSAKSSKGSKSGKSIKVLTPVDGLISAWVQYTGSDSERCPLPDNASEDNFRRLMEKESPCHFEAEVRAIINDPDMTMTDCPSSILEINGEDVQMLMRVPAMENFTNIVCYAKLPLDEKGVSIESIVFGNETLPVPNRDPQKIVVMGDTGCRMGPSHGGLYQSCNNPSLWPFARVSESIMKSVPDLIVHTGDYIYREGPCLEGIAGCEGSPYYDNNTTSLFYRAENFDVWHADWFEPARFVNKVAPLVFIRGNHEECKRAGIGYFRYLHQGNQTNCTDSPFANATQPWVVDFESFQIGVTDTSTAPKENQTSEIQALADQLDVLGDYFSKPALLGTHYPTYGWGASDDDITGTNNGTIEIEISMQLVANATKSGEVPSSIDLLLAAHIHLAEVTSFVGGERPPQLVVANSGTQLIAMSDPPIEIAGLEVKKTIAVYQYGYVLVTKESGGKGWSMDFKDQMGRTLESCSLEKKDVSCA